MGMDVLASAVLTVILAVPPKMGYVFVVGDGRASGTKEFSVTNVSTIR
jgi:hypothetical protein